MATCKDCLHFEACGSMLKALGYTVDGDGYDADKRCDTFKDRSRFVELPCKPGSTVFKIDIYPNDETCGDCTEYCPAFPGDPASCAKDDGYFRCVDCMTISETVATIDNILGWIRFKWFGEFVFLTREEAEAALAERKASNEDRT